MSSLTDSHLVLLIIILTSVSGKVQLNHYLNVTHHILNIFKKNLTSVDLHRFTHSDLCLISCTFLRLSNGRW